MRPPPNLSDDQIEVWQQALEYFQMAFRAQQEGDLAEAIRLYSTSIRLYPSAEAHTFLGWVYSFLNLYDEAIAECHKAIAVDPTFGNPYNDIGAYLMELDRNQEAVDWFRRAIAAPRYGARCYPYFNLGRVYERLGEWTLAIKHYRQALNLCPDYHQAEAAWQLLQARLN